MRVRQYTVYVTRQLYFRRFSEKSSARTSINAQAVGRQRALPYPKRRILRASCVLLTSSHDRLESRLGILEVVIPGFIFLGFAIGAVFTGVMAGLGLTASLPLLILIFAVASVLAWLGLRRVMGVRDNQVKVWDRDINDSP